MKYLEDKDSLLMTIKDWLIYHQSSLVYHKYKDLLIAKNAFDLMIYEEIIWEVKPTIIIEIGSSQGGSALWLADRAKMLLSDIEKKSNETKVITIDLRDTASKNLEDIHKDSTNIQCIVGDCNSPDIINKIKRNILSTDTVLIIEDSSHYYDHVINVLNNYNNIVTVGSYFIIEDGICDVLNFGPVPGPMKAIEKWIENNQNYMIDRSRERYIVTYNPKGFLKRMR